jgi:hypothetical protein
MSTEITERRTNDVHTANGTANLPSAVGAIAAELTEVVTAMAPDDISLDLTVGQDQNRSHIRLCFRAYKHRTEIFSAERENHG